MREKLQKLTDQARHTFTATIGRFGTKTGYKGYSIPTILMKDVKLNGEQVTDHLWFTIGKKLESLHLSENDIVRFDARVGSYRKGYWGEWEKDCCLKYPTAIEKIGHTEA